MARLGHSHRSADPPESADSPGGAFLPKKSPPPPLPVFQPVEVSCPDSLLQTDIPPHDFAHALYSAIDLIPDVPYDIEEYKPQNPVVTPAGYPQMPNMKLLQPEFFRRYDTSTLFYVFFYFPATPQQLYAGRELRQRGWRFHTKYQTWFRRAGEPAEVTAEYEIGRFEYFDHNAPDGWVVRIRPGFKLEYGYLDTD
jgi:CCR4-NOT transcription complex subunit 3